MRTVRLNLTRSGSMPASVAARRIKAAVVAPILSVLGLVLALLAWPGVQISF